MSQLRAEHLAVAYDDHEVIHDLDLDIAEGRITAIAAPTHAASRRFCVHFRG